MSTQQNEFDSKFAPENQLRSGKIGHNWEHINSSNYDDIPKAALYKAIMGYKVENYALKSAIILDNILSTSRYKMSSGNYTDDERKAAMKEAVYAIIKLKKFGKLVHTDDLDEYFDSCRQIAEDFGITYKNHKGASAQQIPDCFKSTESKKKESSKPKK